MRSEEQKAKRAAAARERRKSSEYREWRRQYKQRPEVKAKHAAYKKEYEHRPEVQARVRAAVQRICRGCNQEKAGNEFGYRSHYCLACAAERRKKPCTQCGEMKPKDEFNKGSSVCSSCKAARASVKEKECYKCGQLKPLEDFYISRTSVDGRTPHCRECFYKPKNGRRGYNGDYSGLHPALVRMAMHKYGSMRKRAGNPSGESRHACYANVEVRVSRQDFILWAVPELERFYHEQPYEVASVDRIDPDGHYELGNIRIISHRQNSWANRSNPAYRAELAAKQANFGMGGGSSATA